MTKEDIQEWAAQPSVYELMGAMVPGIAIISLSLLFASLFLLTHKVARRSMGLRLIAIAQLLFTSAIGLWLYFLNATSITLQIVLAASGGTMLILGFVKVIKEIQNA